MVGEEYLMKLSLLQDEAEKMQEQLQIINQQIDEFEVLKNSLGKIEKGKEFLASMGRGIFVESEVKDKELFVNIGQGVIIKKNTEDACKIIDKQISQLAEIKNSLLREIEKISSQLQELVEEARKKG